MTASVHDHRKSHRARAVLAWLVLGASIALIIWRVPDLTARIAALGPGDYIAYWSAGHVCAFGGDPYSPEALLPVQKTEGWPEDWPNIMYYPPWVLGFVMPLGVLPFWTGRLVWLLINVGLVLGCADRIWCYFGGDREHRVLAWLIALSFVPTLIVLRMGQIGPLMLLGVIGFLEAEKRKLDWLAGATLLLAAIKPQLLYLFGLAVVFWSIEQKRYRILAGGIAAAIAVSALVWCRNPQVFQQYRYALANPPSGNVTPTIGAMLRLAIGEEKTWLQYVPTLAGLAWFPFYWAAHRRNWRWHEQAGVLLLASFVTAAYGSWVFDLVILLVPLLQAVVWIGRDSRPGIVALVVSGYVLLDAIALAMNLAGASYPMFIWMTPAIWLGYWAISKHQPRPAVA